MPVQFEPIRRVKCTYEDCAASFNTVKEMHRHKKHAPEHDYCSKCDEDFNSYEDLAMHKVYRPDNHDKACRVCGEEFKSVSGLKRHIELNHKVDQKLGCIGCGEQFFRASLLTEHLEFGHCPVISAVQFQGHIVHKTLISRLLDDPAAYNRFLQKISHHDAAQDIEEEGGVGLMDESSDEANVISFQAIEPEDGHEFVIPENKKPWPLLPPQAQVAGNDPGLLSSQLNGLLLNDDADAESVAETIAPDAVQPPRPRSEKAWKTGKSAQELFRDAKPTPAPSEWSIQYHDGEQEEEHGINIWNTRFWDPTSDDWNPDRFLHPAVDQYLCPFICEQHFDIPADLNKHIMEDHRITSIKCPSCLGSFKSATALVAHCESRGAKCSINKAEDFNKFLDKLTGGFLSVEERIRPEFLNNPTVMVKNLETGAMEPYTPPTAVYLQYTASKPGDWKDPNKKRAVTIGGPPQRQALGWKL